MRCTHCSADNRDGAAYCIQCGSVLGDLCPSCGGALEPRARFCGACGTPSPTAPTAPDREGERKQVTVLFCDLVGSTALAERTGAEGKHGVLDEFFRLASDELGRFGCEVQVRDRIELDLLVPSAGAASTAAP